jgi:osmotically-inducible protein OsmY
MVGSEDQEKFMRKLKWIVVPALMTISALAISDEASDKEITRQVEAAFAQHRDLGPVLYVRTKHGIVYLSGRTSTGFARSNAVDVAKSVPGVKQVVNEVGLSK